LERRVTGDRHDHADWIGCRLGIPQLSEADDLGGSLSHPVAARDTDIEEALGDVHRDLLRTEDPNLGYPRVIDRGPVVDRGGTHHRQIGGLEQVKGRPLERAFRQHVTEHAGRLTVPPR